VPSFFLLFFSGGRQKGRGGSFSGPKGIYLQFAGIYILFNIILIIGNTNHRRLNIAVINLSQGSGKFRSFGKSDM